jgi:hypothetical protein
MKTYKLKKYMNWKLEYPDTMTIIEFILIAMNHGNITINEDIYQKLDADAKEYFEEVI